MGETADIRPIWRTPLAAVLLAWMVIAVTATLTAARLMEVVPATVAPFAVIAVYLLPPPILLVWSFWTMLREPMTGWLGPTVLMAFLGAFVPLFPQLYTAGVRMNFQARRPTYEAIAADIRAGTLAGRPTPRGRLVGARDGVRFRYRPADPGLIDFVWTDTYGFRAGVRYDDTPCVARPGAVCIDRGEPLAERFTYYARVF